MEFDKILWSPVFILVIYLCIVNIYGLIIMGIDKRRSIKRNWRVPEKVLFLTAFIGGALGIYSGMKLFRHKTLHNKFKYGIPLLLILNIIVVAYIFHIY